MKHVSSLHGLISTGRCNRVEGCRLPFRYYLRSPNGAFQRAGPASRCPAVELVYRGMASRAKRRALAPELQANPHPENDDDDDDEEGDDNEEEEEDDDSEEEESGESEKDINEEVNIEFEAHTISDVDYNGIKKLLQQQAEGQEESDDEDGDEDDHVFGFISLFNLTERKGTPCAEQIKELILSKCEKNCEHSVVEQLDKFLNDNSKPVGFLLSERFINVPAQIALPMHQQLQKELEETQRTNKPCGKCYYYLMISKTFEEVSKKPRQGGPQQKEDLMFANAEEEFFYEKALLKFNYSVQEDSDTCLGGRWSFDDVPMKPLRTVMLIPAGQINAIMDKLKEYLSI
uniref:BRCA2 and CDKN1A-interacting protein isoform X2 n=1 Tax=Geotrypetes seraphini TaxID=260995 RepID=A0A6P8R8G1_GEOSA|nr:BRCA2 and CDKN1A-interacting protein isoform X2 [Geotrypetes seraphini]